MQSNSHYPFSALIGQDEMQLALLLNAINPAIGGVLIRGEKGTAKSTAARALAALLPTTRNKKNEEDELLITLHTNAGKESISLSVGASPFVELPIGTSDDRLVGTLDIERALTAGERRFEPGLLARAHGGVLYVDEVNLLADHIVDLLLDVAASGVNSVEREGISASHLARFLLIGTMNPEEGDLRPQLLDRFGLTVDVIGPRDAAIRSEVVRRRIAYEADPTHFVEQYIEQDRTLASRVAVAKAELPRVLVPDSMLELMTQICIGSEVDGLRADITMYKTASTLTAWDGRFEVTADDVRQAARFVLPHRRRRQPFEEPGLDEQQLDDLMNQHRPRNDTESGQNGSTHNPNGGSADEQDAGSDGSTAEGE